MEDDPIVKYIPVNVCTRLRDKLHIFQYPMEKKPFEKRRPVAARIKPKAGIIELEIPIDCNKTTYNEEKASRFTENVETLLKTMPLRADKYLCSNQFLCVYRQDQVFLTSIESIFNFYPYLKHIDAADQLKIKAEVEKEKKVEKKSILRIENEEMIEARKRNPGYMMKEAEAESFIKLNYFDLNSYDSDAVGAHLVSDSCVKREYEKHPYFKKLKSEEELKKKICSLSDLRTLMLNVKLMPLENIIRLLDSTQEHVLEQIHLCAVPIFNVWVVMSTFLYSGRTAMARDYLITMFRNSTAEVPEVSRWDFSQVVGLDVEQTEELLSQLAFKTKTGLKTVWRLKYSVCRSFEHEAYKNFENTMIFKDSSPKNTPSSPVLRPLATFGPGQHVVPNNVPLSILAHLNLVSVSPAAVMLQHLKAKHPNVSEEEIQSKIDERCILVQNSYVLRSKDATYDAMRSVVIDLFKNTPKITKNEILHAINEVTGKKISVKAFTAIMDELSNDKKSPYYLKTYAP